MTDAIAASQDYADLFSDNPKAAALFLMMLPFLDCYGILSADPDVFKGKVCPKLKVRDIGSLLEGMERHGLIERYYDAEDHPLLWVRKYHKHQDVRWDRVGPPDQELPTDWECPDELSALAEGNPGKPIGRWYAKWKASFRETPGDSGSRRARAVQTQSSSVQTRTPCASSAHDTPPSADVPVLELTDADEEVERIRLNNAKREVVQEMWEAFGFTGNPSPNTFAKFLKKDSCLDGAVAVAHEYSSYIRTGAVPIDPDSSKDAFFWKATSKALCCPEGCGWRKQPGGNGPSAPTPSWQGWPPRFAVESDESLTGKFTEDELANMARAPDGDWYQYPWHNVNGSEQQRAEKARRLYKREQASGGQATQGQ